MWDGHVAAARRGRSRCSGGSEKGAGVVLVNPMVGRPAVSFEVVLQVEFKGRLQRAFHSEFHGDFQGALQGGFHGDVPWPHDGRGFISGRLLTRDSRGSAGARLASIGQGCSL